MTSIVKLFSKPGHTIYITTSYGLDQRSNTRQNSVNIDTSNFTNKLDFALDNSDTKINIIITISNTNIL